MSLPERTPEQMALRERLKAKGLLYLWTTFSGPDIKSYKLWAIEINTTYPWACSLGFREDASAFTPEFVRYVNEHMEKAKMDGYFSEPASEDHDGPIYYIKTEIA